MTESMGVCNFFFNHSSVDGHLVWLHILAIVNRAKKNMDVTDSFPYIPRSGAAGSYGGSIFSCLLRDFFAYFHSD